MSFAIGIDLGTSTSEICVFRNGEPYVIPDPSTPGKSPIVPSIVAVNSAGELIVGELARSYVNRTGKGVREVKRKMGSGDKIRLGTDEYTPEQLSAVILKHLKHFAEEAVGEPIKDVVLSVPANFPDAARQATLTAGQMAGLNVVRLMNEPTAAALAFGVKNIDAAEQLVVFDFGGGTLDITALEMTEGILDVKASYGDTQLGGKDFDEVMIELILQKFSAQHAGAKVSATSRGQLKGFAEEAKIALSRQRSTMVTQANFATANGEPIDLDVVISREEFERAVAPLLERARVCVRKALAAGQLKPGAIDRVLLVGGTTYMPCVRQLVADLFNKEPRADVNPDTAVATGAAVQAALAARLITADTGITVLDVSPFGLGIDLLNSSGNGLIYEPLMPPNTKIPFSVKKDYKLIHASQKQVEFKLYQDHTGKARVPEDAIETGVVAHITNIPPSADGIPHTIEVDFSYDLNAIARITACLPATGQSVAVVYDKTAKRPSAETVEAAKEQVEQLWTKNPQAGRFQGLITKATDRAKTAPPEARGRILAAVSALQDALTRDDSAAIQKTSDVLTDLLFDLETEN